MGKMTKAPAPIARKAAAYKAYGSQASKQPGWGGMGSKSGGGKKMFKRVPKK